MIFIALLIGTLAPAQTATPKNILIINEVGLTYPAIALITEQLLTTLSAGNPAQLYLESLDTTSYQDEESLRASESWLVDKYQNRKVDVIVAVGPGAVKFLSRHSAEFLPTTPVVVCGALKEQAGNLELGARFTGFWMTVEPDKTVEVALQLYPGLRHLFVVGGSSTFDRGVEEVTRTRLRPFESKLEISYWTDLDMTTLLERVRYLPGASIVLYLSFFRDAAGSQFMNATSALPIISGAANAPVFGMSDTYIGNGIVGGRVLWFAEQGRMAAVLASQILSGKRAEDIPLQTSPGVYMFDARQMERWRLQDTNLPLGSIVRFREPTLWQRAKWMLLASLFVILALGLITAYLLHERRQLQAARKEQHRLSGRLIVAQEDERRRLAAELHDDFSQRLALLSLGMEMAAEEVGYSPDAGRKMNDLINSASEIGADLHALSHKLHSSTLQRLGLVPGIASFCKEFGAQGRTKISFSHSDVLPVVTPEVSLCLFRIVQEALRNVRKHSGATNAQVRLDASSRSIHLSISDNGDGFDLRDTSKPQGVGLLSMRERARLAGGRLKVKSRKGKGTRVAVWVPIDQRHLSSPPDSAAADHDRMTA